MATQNKTIETDESVKDFIESFVDNDQKKDDSYKLIELMKSWSGFKPKMWGPSIIGFGVYNTTYASGRKVEWMRSGFSPRKAKHSLYLMGGYCDEIAAKQREEALTRLGKHSTGKSCLYVNKLADIDLGVLEEMIAADWETMARIYPD